MAQRSTNAIYIDGRQVELEAYIAAWDYYHNGSFQYTRYSVLSL